MTKLYKITGTSFLIAAITSCAANSVQPVGSLGPNHLPVYVIKNNDFLSSSRMLVVLDQKGNVSAYTGTTVPGAGAVTMQAAESAVSAGAVIVGSQAIANGLQNTRIRGIPETVRLKHDMRTSHKVFIKKLP